MNLPTGKILTHGYLAALNGILINPAVFSAFFDPHLHGQETQNQIKAMEATVSSKLVTKKEPEEKWVWVKIKPPGIGPQELVLGSIYQGKPFGVTLLFEPQPNDRSFLARLK